MTVFDRARPPLIATPVARAAPPAVRMFGLALAAFGRALRVGRPGCRRSTEPRNGDVPRPQVGAAGGAVPVGVGRLR